MNSAARSQARTLLSFHALGFILLASLAANWPVLLHGGHPFTMWDSFDYMDEGDRIRGVIGGWFEQIASTAPSLENPVGGAGDGDEPKSIRSLPYTAFLGTLLPLGVTATIWLQTCLVMTMVYAFLAPALEVAPRLARLLAAGVMLIGTQLPFMASFLMPDILGAVVVLYGALLARGLENFDRSSQVILGAIALFSIISHYGNIPLALAVFSVAVLTRADSWARVRQVILAVMLAIVAALGANAVLGVVAFGEVSVTPGRYPILLARSIQDGPARWHLEEQCATENYAVCEWWDGDIPRNVGKALWDERGMANAPPELYARIRDEEFQILWRSFKSYPVAQIVSLTRNAGRQLLWAGASYANVSHVVSTGPEGRDYEDAAHQPLKAYKREIGWGQKATYLAALAYLAFIAVFRPNVSRQRQVIAVLAVAILANAAIFGGLSAPADRYGARIAWVMALAALAFAMERRWRTRGPEV